METKENWSRVIESNKLIHEFMRLEPEIEYCIMSNDETAIRYSPKNIGFYNSYQQKVECEKYMEERKNGYMYMPMDKYKIGTLKNYPYYNNNWNELIKVIEKIEEGDFGFKMCRKVVEVYRDSTKELILKVKEKNRLESAYKAVVEFIMWQKNRIKRSMRID